MKTFINALKTALALCWFASSSLAQCPNNNNPYGFISNLNPGQTSTVFCMYGGDYATVNVVNGSQYTFSTCGGSWDSQLTLYSSSGNYLAYNDDACGLQSEINWTANFTGQVRVNLDRYFCNSLNSCMNLNVTRGAAPATNPCGTVESLICETSVPFNLPAGNGAWAPGGPYGTPGNEQVYSFTPLNTGIHEISVNHSSGGWVDLFIKSGSCSSTGWTYIDDVFSSATNFLTLNAGQTYYFLLDDENTSASSGSISIDCPTPVADPCTLISELTCDQPSSFALSSGSGAWNPPGPWGTPGNEQVYSYTPQVSGTYDVQVNHTSSGWVDLFYKAGNCGQNGWSYVNDIFSSETNSLNLTGGVTYYFLIDDENTSASSGSINISCPCLGNTVDAVLTLNNNVSVSNNTQGACDDCGLRSSEDITYEVNIPCAGEYTFETCNLATWDTYLYLTSSPCSGILASNDDNCSLRSSITYSFNSGGTYYLTVEGFSSSSAGQFALSISKTCDLGVSLSSNTYACGNNISCFGANDGAAVANATGGCGNITYQWSNGSNSNTANQLSPGNYSLVVTDEWQCAATANISITEPTQLIADAGEDETVYYGYTPLSCADISASAQGGCPEYSYSWSANGSIMSTNTDENVCPNVSTNYELTVTDENGCTATDNVEICVVDVTCYAGNSNNQKVEMCHVPPGNSGNAHTICINESAVATHLAHGCTLGSCEEVNYCPSSNIIARNGSQNGSNEKMASEKIQAKINVFPNPFIEAFEIDFLVEQSDEYIFKLYSTQGKLVKTIYAGYMRKNEHFSMEIPSATLEKGLYILRGSNSSGDFQESLRLIKQ